MTPAEVSHNLTAIGAEKVAKIMLIAESIDQLAVRGRDRLFKGKEVVEK